MANIKWVVWPYMLERLEGREWLSHDTLHSRCFPDLPHQEFMECATFLEGECLPVGMMRPDDDLVALMTPPGTWNPLKFVYWRAAFEDSIGDIDHQLGKRLAAKAIERPPGFVVRSVKDYIRAWCGILPELTKETSGRA